MPFLKVTVAGGFQQEVEIDEHSTLSITTVQHGAQGATMESSLAWSQLEDVELNDSATLEPDDGNPPFAKMTKADLLALADDYGVEVPAGASKAEVAELLAAAER